MDAQGDLCVCCSFATVSLSGFLKTWLIQRRIYFSNVRKLNKIQLAIGSLFFGVKLMEILIINILPHIAGPEKTV